MVLNQFIHPLAQKQFYGDLHVSDSALTVCCFAIMNKMDKGWLRGEFGLAGGLSIKEIMTDDDFTVVDLLFPTYYN